MEFFLTRQHCPSGYAVTSGTGLQSFDHCNANGTGNCSEEECPFMYWLKAYEDKIQSEGSQGA